MTVLLAVDHAVHLVVDPVQQAIGIDRSGNSQFGIRMAAHPRLKQNKVVRIARGQRKVLNLLGVDGPTNIDAGGFDQRSAPGDLDRSRDACQRHVRIDHRLLAGLQQDFGGAYDGEAVLRNDDLVAAQRKIGKHVVPLQTGLHTSREAVSGVVNRDRRALDRGIGGIRYPSSEGTVDRVRLCEGLRAPSRTNQG